MGNSFELVNRVFSQNLLLKYKSRFSVAGTLYWTNWVLIGGLVWLSGILVSNILEHKFLDIPQTLRRFVPQEKAQPDISQPHSKFKAIIDVNVFDAEVTSQTVVEEEIVETPASAQLEEILSKLTLLGIYQGKNQYCILKDNKTRAEEIFGVNDEVFQTGAVIEKIQITDGRQIVYVRLNDEVGRLENPEKKESDQKVAMRQAVPTNKRPQRKIIRPTQDQPPNRVSQAYSSNGKDYFLRTAEVQGHIRNFATLLNQAKVVPYIEDGKNVGYTIKNITKGSLYEKLGLKNFDIIQSVNGNAIDSMEKAIELFHTLKNEREITINILRNKKPLSFNYHIN